MQQVATAKSDIAAIATSAGSERSLDSGLNQEFERLLQDQQGKELVVARPAEKGTSAFEKASKSTDKSAKVTDTPDKKNNTESVKSTTDSTLDTPVDNDYDEKITKIMTAEELVESQQSAGKQQLKVENSQQLDGLVKISGTSDPEVHSEKKPLQILNEQSQVDLKQTGQKHDTPVTQKITTDSDKASEWVMLVENLQKLTGKVESPEPAELDRQEKFGQQLVEKSNNEKLIIEDIVQDITLPTKNGFEKKASLAAEKESGVTDDLVLGNGKLPPEAIQKLVQKVLESQSSTKAELSLGAETKPKLAVDELLKQPELLQQVFEEFSKIQVKENSEGDETVLLETTNSQLSVVSDDNKALLNILMTGTEAKNSADEVNTDISENVDKAESVKQSLQIATDEVLQEAHRLDEELPISSGNAEKIDILEANLLKDGPMSSSLKTLANLPEAKQDKVLINIAQRLLALEPKAQTDTIQSVESNVNKEVADVVSLVASPVKEFIGALKSGLSEFKDQLSKGHEPGIDLKSLVKESINQVLESNPSVKMAQNSEQIMAGVSQLIDFATSVNRGMEQQTASLSQNYSAALRDVSQIQGEQTKQAQLSQVESKFDKAVNIAKPEGLQQLAEKVRWMANTKNLVAEIRLDPAELGSVHVKVAMSGETATVSFVVQSQQTRDAMDSATPRLREMLAEKGIELGQSSVRQESDNQQRDGNGQLTDNNHSSQENIEDDETAQHQGLQQKIVNGALGGIDYFV